MIWKSCLFVLVKLFVDASSKVDQEEKVEAAFLNFQKDGSVLCGCGAVMVNDFRLNLNNLLS